MTQIDIMEFFDENPGKYYTISELTGIMLGKMGKVSVARCVKKVIRRKEYVCIMMYGVSGGRLTTYYGKNKEETPNGRKQGDTNRDKNSRGH